MLYFHGGKKGHKIDAIRRSNKASFCVYDQGSHKDGTWALYFKSVIVFGRIGFVEDPEIVNRVTVELSRKFTDDADYIQREVDTFGPATLLFAMKPEYITGKSVKES